MLLQIYVIFEQSTVGEMVKDKLIPQFPGRACANWSLKLVLFDTVLRQLQADCLSAVLVIATERKEAPLQQAVGGNPLPLFK